MDVKWAMLHTFAIHNKRVQPQIRPSNAKPAARGQPTMKVSIKDIAARAGVSHSTVSRALSNNPLIAEATRRRLQGLAQEMGYSPNAIARGLVRQQTYTIGVIVTTIEDPFVAEVVRGIEE